MTPAVLYTFFAVSGVSIISLIGIVTISMREALLRRFLPLLVALAAGALFGGAVLHLIPEAFETLEGSTASFAILSGILVFFVLEHLLHWHHHHRPHMGEQACEDCEERVHPMGSLVLGADVIHNMLDGAIIAGAFLVSVEVGIATTIAVALHEIPQEIGDFGILLHAGFTKAKALLANLLSALTAFAGAAAVFLFAAAAEAAIPLLSAFAGGGFLYIAAADLVPELHERAGQGTGNIIVRMTTLLLGVAVMYGLLFLE